MRRWAAVLAVVLVVSGCRAAIRDNFFSCDVDDNCPPGLSCVAGFCTSGARDGSTADRDAGDPTRDGGGFDGGPTGVDGGPPGVDGGPPGVDGGAPDGGPPPAITGTERAFRLGSLIIPMDTTHQPAGLLKAFGLVHRLLANGVPVSWVVRPGKALDEADFTVSSRDLVSGTTFSSQPYAGGPFVVHVDDVAAATSLVSAWRTVHPETTVHAATEDFTGFVRTQLVAAPNLALFADGNHDIAQPMLQAAFITDSAGSVAWDEASPDFLTPAEVVGPTTTNHHDGALFDGDGDPVYCFMASMHWSLSDSITTEGVEVVAEYREFVQRPGHIFGMCQAAVSIENSVNGHFLTPNGFVTGNAYTLSSYEYLLTDLPYSQMEGPFQGVGGSYPWFSLPSGDDYYDTNVVSISALTVEASPAGRGTADIWITGFADGDCAIASEPCEPPNAMGKVSYLGGHRYTADLPLSVNPQAQAARLFLNALLDSPCASELYQPYVSAVVDGPSGSDGPTTTWTVRYDNRGYGTALDARLAFALPPRATVVSASPGGRVEPGRVVWDLDNLGPDERGEARVTVRLAEPGRQRVSARVTFRSGQTPREVSAANDVCYRCGAGRTAP